MNGTNMDGNQIYAKNVHEKENMFLGRRHIKS